MSDVTFNADGKQMTGGIVGCRVVLFELSRRLDDLWMHPESHSDASTSLIARDALERIEHLERVLAQARDALKDSDVRVYELCSTSSVPEPAATRARTAKSIAAIDEALK